MKLNIARALNGVATVAGLTGACPLTAVLTVANALSGHHEQNPSATSPQSPLASALVTALGAAVEHKSDDPLALVERVVDAIHPPQAPAEVVTPGSDRAKVLADRQRLADGMARIQALIAQLPSRR